MRWSTVITLLFAIASLFGAAQSAFLQISLMQAIPSEALPAHRYLDIGGFLVVGFSAYILNGSPKRGSSIRKEMLNLYPKWIRVIFGVYWICGFVLGLFSMFMYISSSPENRDYWQLRQASIVTLMLYSLSFSVLCAELKRQLSPS